MTGLNSVKYRLMDLRQAFPLAILMLLGLGLTGCERQELPADMEEEPVLFFRAEIDGKEVDFPVGAQGITGASEMYDVNNRRYWRYVIKGADSMDMESFTFYLYNHEVPFGDPLSDLDSTIDTGNYDFAFAIAPISDPYQKSHVSARFRDKSGREFTSTRVLQPGAKFEIMNIENIIYNGQHYRQVDVEFDFWMYNSVFQDTMIVRNGQAKMLFGGAVPIGS